MCPAYLDFFYFIRIHVREGPISCTGYNPETAKHNTSLLVPKINPEKHCSAINSCLKLSFMLHSILTILIKFTLLSTNKIRLNKIDKLTHFQKRIYPTYPAYKSKYVGNIAPTQYVFLTIL